MKKTLLLPRKCRPIGCILLPFSIALLVAITQFNYSIGFLHYPYKKAVVKNGITIEDNGISMHDGFIFSKDFSADFTFTVALVLTFAALFMIAFSREKREDEYISFIRLRALQICVYANYIILVLAALTIFGFNFLAVMEINLFTILILFILIYQYQLNIKPRIFKNPTV